MANDITDGEARPCPHAREGDLPPELIRQIKACACAITGEPQAVEDILQQVYSKLLSVPKDKWGTIQIKWGYVMRIAQNESRTWLKLRRRMTAPPGRFGGAPTVPPGAGWDVQDLVRLFEPLGRERAEAYIRVRIYGRTVRTAARKMDLREKVVQAHVEAADLHFVRLLEGNPQEQSIIARLIEWVRRRRS